MYSKGSSDALESEKSKGGDLYLLNGVRVRKEVFWRSVCGLVICLVAAALLVVVPIIMSRSDDITKFVDEGSLNSEQTGRIDSVVDDESSAVSDVIDTNTFDLLLQKHLHASGQAGIESMSYIGTYQTRGIAFDLIILSKRLKLFRQTLKYKQLRIEAGFDGQNYWQHNPLSANEDSAPSPAKLLNAELVQLQCSQGILSWAYEKSGRAGLSFEGQVERSGRMYYVIQNEALVNQIVRHYIDVESCLEVRRETILQLQDAEFPVQIEYQYSDRAKARRPVVADSYQLFFAGSELASVTIDSVRTNAGIMPWMFEDGDVD